MNRREILKRTGALAGAVSLGGCLGQVSTPGGAGGDETTGPPTLVEQSLTVTDAGCGSTDGEATVEFDDATSSVVVTGSIPGSDLCKTATLADVAYDPDAGTLEVTVATKDREDAGACGDCITAIDYEATVEFDGGLPGSVTVVHQGMNDSKTVATAESG